MPVVVDAHCDTLTVLTKQKRKLGALSSQGHLDLPRLRQGGTNVQFFAIFVGPDFSHNPVGYTNEIINLFNSEIHNNQSNIKHVKCYEDITSGLLEQKVCAVLTIEGGEALNGNLEQLTRYYNQGVRGLTLTWNGRNELGDGVGMGPAATGLTALGRQVVHRMSSLGMMIDISHLSKPSFWDVVSEVRTPIIATHSNCQSICDHPRNLTDKQIRAIAERGGVIGVTYMPPFIDSHKPNTNRLLDHIDHLHNVGGIDCIGLGSDFDGIDSTAEGLQDASTAVPNIVYGLSKRGYNSNKIEKVLGNNWLRLFKEVCG